MKIEIYVANIGAHELATALQPTGLAGTVFGGSSFPHHYIPPTVGPDVPEPGAYSFGPWGIERTSCAVVYLTAHSVWVQEEQVEKLEHAIRTLLAERQEECAFVVIDGVPDTWYAFSKTEV